MEQFDVNDEVIKFNQKLVNYLKGKQISRDEYIKEGERYFKGNYSPDKEDFKHFEFEMKKWNMLKEIDEEEKVRVFEPKEKSLDDIVRDAFYWLDVAVDRLKKGDLKTLPTERSAKTGRSKRFEELVLKYTGRELTIDEITEVYKIVWPVWVDKIKLIKKDIPEKAKPKKEEVEPIKFVPELSKPKKEPRKTFTESIEPSNLEYPFKSKIKRKKFLIDNPDTKQANLISDSHFKKIKKKNESANLCIKTSYLRNGPHAEGTKWTLLSLYN